MPVRKPGWWELTITVTGPTPRPVHQTARLCTDAAVDQVQTPFVIHAGGGCSPVQVSRTPDGWTFEGTCVIANMTVATQGRASGDFSSRYHVDLTTRLTPPPAPEAAEVRTAIDAKWLARPAPRTRRRARRASCPTRRRKRIRLEINPSERPLAHAVRGRI